MTIVRREIALVFLLFLIIIFIFFLFRYSEYNNYNQSTEKIKFIQIDTSSLNSFTDIFKDSFFKDKTTYIVLDFYVWNEDLAKNFPYFKKLSNKYKDKPFQILYTNDGFHGAFNHKYDFYKELRHKKGIHKHNLYGYHAVVPSIFKFKGDNWLESVRYLLIKDGIIIDTFPPIPYRYKELCEKIDTTLAVRFLNPPPSSD